MKRILLRLNFYCGQAMGRFLQRSTPNSAVDFLAPASALDAMGHDERVSFFFLLCRGLTTDSGDGHSENAQQNRRFLVWFSRILFSESEELRADALHNTAVGLIGEQQYRTAISLLVGRTFRSPQDCHKLKLIRSTTTYNSQSHSTL